MAEEHEAILSSAASRLSHEIKNSLAGIGGALAVLSDRLPSDSRVEEVMQRIRAELKRIDRSVGELATFAAPAAPVRIQRDFHAVIERALERVPLTASTRVTKRFGPDVPPLRIDEKLLTDALGRLFLNAIQAMPEGGTLTLTTSWHRDHVLLSVQDTGHGIPHLDPRKVFEPFITSRMQGLGLGLAIARRLVEAHGGSVWVSSTAGGGAEFTISLPLDQ